MIISRRLDLNPWKVFQALTLYWSGCPSGYYVGDLNEDPVGVAAVLRGIDPTEFARYLGVEGEPDDVP